MASRRKHNQKGEEFKQEDILQAVVIADSFNVRFAPVTKHTPRTLLPLANIPLLDYTLEFLESGGIQEVILFCCAHAAQVKAYLARSKWSNSVMEIITIVSENCLSVGDALRDIDAKSLITNDFVLVNGDMVSNVKLAPIIKDHKTRRLKDKGMMMTMLFKKAPPCHVIRCEEDEVVMAIKPSDNTVLSFQKLGNLKKFDFPLDIFTDNKSVQLRYDLLDTHICVCSPHVPQLFTDNFDFQSRDDFVRGILVDTDVLGNTVRIHDIEDEYAARVSNLHMYDAISRDVLMRWVYPMVPDSLTTDEYSYGRHNTYLHKDITLARGCILKENIIIGRGSSVGCNSTITNSVIGQNCSIGENVDLDGAYIWDGVRVDDNCVLKSCVLDTKVYVKKNVTIKPGCVLGCEVIVGPDIVLDSSTLLSAEPPTSEWEEEDEVAATIDPAVVGEEGRAYLYQHPTDSDDEEEEEDLVQQIWGMKIESEEEDTESISSQSDDDDGGMSPVPDEPRMFFEEVTSTLERDIQENIGNDNMILEVNSVKHAYGIQIQEVNQLLTKAIIALPMKTNPSIEPPQYLALVKTYFKRFISLIKNYIRSEESQIDCLKAMEDFCVENSTTQRVLVKVIHHLYEEEILSEEAILTWYTSTPTDEVTAKKAVRKVVAPFITWLEEAEEDSEEESD